MKTATLHGFAFLAVLAACSSDPVSPSPSPSPGLAGTGAAGRAAAAAAGSGGGLAGSLAGTPATQAGTAAVSGKPTMNTMLPPDDGCGDGKTFKREGCPCRAGETAACWTGAAADRNVGMCHDGLQICTGSSEFAQWGPCNGEELTCGTDAGVPPPPPPPPEEGGCPCIPGAVIQCSEDCSVGIICSLTATKTCLPDHTWTPCREDVGAMLELPGIQCRNMLHGCLSSEGDEGELYVGDCSKQFKCGRAPTAL